MVLHSQARVLALKRKLEKLNRSGGLLVYRTYCGRIDAGDKSKREKRSRFKDKIYWVGNEE